MLCTSNRFGNNCSFAVSLLGKKSLSLKPFLQLFCVNNLESPFSFTASLYLYFLNKPLYWI